MTFAASTHLPPGLLAAPAPGKRDYRGSLNLSSNELHHPALAGFFASFLRHWDGATGVTRYPYHPVATARVAELSGTQPDRVVLAPGSDDAIRMLMWTVAAASGRLVLQEPNYPGYALHASAAGANVQCVGVFALSPDERLDRLRAAVERTPRACVVITDPDPVEGLPLGPERIERLADACAERDCVLVIDAAYAAFAGVDHLDTVGGRSNVLVVRTFSKSLGLAGLRAASVFGPRDLVAGLARWRPVNAVSSLTLDLLAHCLAERAFWEAVHADVIRWRQELSRELERGPSGWTTSGSQANFVLVATPSAGAAATAADKLANAGIVVKRFAGAAPALRCCMRLSVPAPDGMQLLLETLSP